MQAVLNNGEAGPKLPTSFSNNVIAFAVIVLSAVMAAMVLAVTQPGSALVLCFLLPFGLVLKDYLAKPRSHRAHVLPIMAAVALFGVALEPGALNVALTWALLVAMAVAARSTESILPLSLLGGVGRSALITPSLIAIDGIAAAKKANTKAAHMPRPPVTSLFLPIIAVGAFSLLLASANPVIESVLLALQLDAPLQFLGNVFELLSDWTSFVFLCAMVLLWPILRGTTTLRARGVGLETTTPSWHRLFFKRLRWLSPCCCSICSLLSKHARHLARLDEGRTATRHDSCGLCAPRLLYIDCNSRAGRVAHGLRHVEGHCDGAIKIRP